MCCRTDMVGKVCRDLNVLLRGEPGTLCRCTNWFPCVLKHENGMQVVPPRCSRCHGGKFNRSEPASQYAIRPISERAQGVPLSCARNCSALSLLTSFVNNGRVHRHEMSPIGSPDFSPCMRHSISQRDANSTGLGSSVLRARIKALGWRETPHSRAVGSRGASGTTYPSVTWIWCLLRAKTRA